VTRGRAALAVIVAVAIGAAVFALGLSSTRDRPPTLPAAGDAQQGRAAIAEYGCGSCHTIPGVRAANAKVGPPLTDWPRRAYVAGQLANTPANVARWVAHPQAIQPATAMPDLGVSASTARDIAAYLFSLR
jgi:cytochrome c2